MQKRTRLTSILIAGTLSVFILTIFLAFRSGNQTNDDAIAAEQVASVELVGEYETDMAVLQAQIDSLQAQNEELRAAVNTMQAREAEYQNQIDIANQTIEELSTQNSSGILTGEGFGAFPARPERHTH